MVEGRKRPEERKKTRGGSKIDDAVTNMDMDVDDIDWAESERPVGVVLKKKLSSQFMACHKIGSKCRIMGPKQGGQVRLCRSTVHRLGATRSRECSQTSQSQGCTGKP